MHGMDVTGIMRLWTRGIQTQTVLIPQVLRDAEPSFQLQSRARGALRHSERWNANGSQEKKRTKGLELFDLPQDCTEKDLEAAYRRLARSMHPDKNGGTEAEIFTAKPFMFLALLALERRRKSSFRACGPATRPQIGLSLWLLARI